MKFTKSPLALLCVLLACCLCIFSCGDEAETVDVGKTGPKADSDFGQKAYNHTAKILSFGPRPIESRAHKKTQDYIIQELEKNRWVTFKQTFKTKTPHGERTFTNIIARYNVSRNVGKAETLSPKAVLAAHYDSKLIEGFLGADDAASCVGGLLELAEYFHKNEPAKAKMIELVFFDGEEALREFIIPRQDGLYGSIHYSEFLHYDVLKDNKLYTSVPQFGIVLDMVGHKNLNIKIPSDTPKSLADSYNKVVNKGKYNAHFGTAPGKILDDHVPMNQLAKIPTIDIIGDFSVNEWWHTKKDNINLISKDSLSMSLRVTLGVFNDQLKKRNL